MSPLSAALARGGSLPLSHLGSPLLMDKRSKSGGELLKKAREWVGGGR